MKRASGDDLCVVDGDGRGSGGLENADVIPIFKKGNRDSPGNYLPNMIVIDYQVPKFSMETVDSVYVGDRENALVLDVPCGTEFVADGLHKLGFKNFHGIDGSERMLKIAESKGLYQRLTCWILTSDKPLPPEPGAYDLVMIVGGLAQQHLPWDILPEMLRVTKPGGFICFTLRAEESDHRSKLLASVQELVSKGLWEKVVEQCVEKWQKEMLKTGLAEEYADGVVDIYRKI